jgi:cyclic dehypoxanthinyl futalosine synthase
MLDDDVRRRVSPKKQSAAGWLEAMRIAQRLGLVTSATMVIGFGETLEQRVGHLRKLRDLQDESLAAHGNGFTAFIAWTLQTDHTPMGRSKGRAAVARLFLDNFSHVQASWPTQGLRLAEVALEFGCDDFGSTMLEENVVSAAGTSLRHVAEITMQRHIHKARATGRRSAIRVTTCCGSSNASRIPPRHAARARGPQRAREADLTTAGADGFGRSRTAAVRASMRA